MNELVLIGVGVQLFAAFLLYIHLSARSAGRMERELEYEQRERRKGEKLVDALGNPADTASTVDNLRKGEF